MPKVKVWNDNTYPYEEKFKGEQLKIAPKAYILMDADEAIDFRGTYAPIKLNGDGGHTAQGFKMIRIEPLGDGVEMEATPAAKTTFVCNACQYSASSDKDLLEHSSLNHKDSVFVDAALETELKSEDTKTMKKKAFAKAG